MTTLMTTETDDSVAIVAAKATVSEAETASFQVIAKTTNTNPRTIRVMVTEVGDFISGTTYDNPVDVSIPGGKLFGSLDIALDDDRKYETNGSITATILAEDLTGGGTATYSLASASSATIAVTNNDDDLPIISISSSAESYGVTEGGSFEFTVTSDRTITGAPLVVNLTPGYTGGAVNPGAAIAGNSVSIPVDGTTNTGTVTMVSGFDIGDSDTVHIDVAIAADYANYEIGDDNAIAVRVKDNDDPSTTNPRLSIAAVATESVRLSPSVTSVGFTITASDDPSDDDLSVNVVVTETQNFIASAFDKTPSINFEDTGTTTSFNVDVVDPSNQMIPTLILR